MTNISSEIRKKSCKLELKSHCSSLSLVQTNDYCSIAVLLPEYQNRYELSLGKIHHVFRSKMNEPLVSFYSINSRCQRHKSWWKENSGSTVFILKITLLGFFWGEFCGFWLFIGWFLCFVCLFICLVFLWNVLQCRLKKLQAKNDLYIFVTFFFFFWTLYGFSQNISLSGNQRKKHICPKTCTFYPQICPFFPVSTHVTLTVPLQ